MAIDEDGIAQARRSKARMGDEFKGVASVPLYTEDIERNETLRFIEDDEMSRVVKNIRGEVWEMPGQ